MEVDNIYTTVIKASAYDLPLNKVADEVEDWVQTERYISKKFVL